MSQIKKELNRTKTPEELVRQVISLLKGESTIVINLTASEMKDFISGIKAAKFIGINQSELAKILIKYKFYLGRDFFVYKSYTNLDSIYNSEAYKIVISKAESSSPFI